jgi:hypothetical protein
MFVTNEAMRTHNELVIDGSRATSSPDERQTKVTRSLCARSPRSDETRRAGRPFDVDLF